MRRPHQRAYRETRRDRAHRVPQQRPGGAPLQQGHLDREGTHAHDGRRRVGVPRIRRPWRANRQRRSGTARIRSASAQWRARGKRFQHDRRRRRQRHGRAACVPRLGKRVRYRRGGMRLHPCQRDHGERSCRSRRRPCSAGETRQDPRRSRIHSEGDEALHHLLRRRRAQCGRAACCPRTAFLVPRHHSFRRRRKPVRPVFGHPSPRHRARVLGGRDDDRRFRRQPRIACGSTACKR